MVLSLALASIVLMAITSAIVLASRAIPDARQDPALDASLDAAAALSRITQDARYALYFSELSATAVTFAVPDRDSDGYPDRVRYHWSGAAGTPLYRSYNGGPDTVVLDAVASLAFSTESESEAFSYTGADIKSGEALLSYFYSTSGVGDKTVEYAKWYAQYFKPSLSSDVLRWQVSRAFFALAYESPKDGSINASIFAVNSSGKPTGSALDTAAVSEAVLSSAATWYEINYANAPVMSPGSALAIAFSQTAGNNNAGHIYYANLNASVGYHESTDTGYNWNYRSDRTMLYYLFGYYWTPGVTRTLTRTRYNRFAVNATVTGATGSPVRSACNLDNRPYAASRFWRLTFDEPNPTLVDANADGVADWKTRNDSTFDTTDISNGVWNCDQTIDSMPEDNFTEPTVIDLRIKSTTANQAGAGFWINADWGAGSSNAGIYGRLVGGSTSQTLNFYLEVPGTDPITKQVANLPLGFINVRLVVDPTNNEVALFANGVHQGTYSFVFESDVNDTRNVTLEEPQGGAVFDQITVVEGGSY